MAADTTRARRTWRVPVGEDLGVGSGFTTRAGTHIGNGRRGSMTGTGTEICFTMGNGDRETDSCRNRIGNGFTARRRETHRGARRGKSTTGTAHDGSGTGARRCDRDTDTGERSTHAQQQQLTREQRGRPWQSTGRRRRGEGRPAMGGPREGEAGEQEEAGQPRSRRSGALEGRGPVDGAGRWRPGGYVA